MSTALAQYAGSGGELMQWRQPEEVLAEAKTAATALVKVIEMKKNKVVFNGETYLEFEDWQTVAKFYGCTAKVISTKYVEYGEAHGFESEAVVLDRNQSEIGRAESMCLSDEENWGMIPKYEWKDVLDAQGKKIWDQNLRSGKGGYKATKVQVGATAKPLFQLRSMAQTRASAKALRSIFAWVVVLAGYKPTPAEEMTGHEFDNEPEPRQQVQMPKSTDETKPQVQQGKAETVQQNAPAAQAVTQGQQGAPLEKLSGEIASVTPGNNGLLVLAVNGGVVLVPGRLATDDFVTGAKILCLVKKVTVKGQNCLEVHDVEMIVPPAEEGAIIDAEVSDPDPSIANEEAYVDQLATDLFGSETPKTKPTSLDPPGRQTAAVTEATKPGTAGLKRGQRLHTLISQNHKNTLFTEEKLKQYLATQRIEHARDLMCPPKGSEAFNAYEYACSMAVGEVDWHEVLED